METKEGCHQDSQFQHQKLYGTLEILPGQLDSKGKIIPHQMIPITESSTKIGRRPDMNIKILDTRVSGYHAYLAIDFNYTVSVRNYSKVNSVTVNGGAVPRNGGFRHVSDGDLIEIGGVIKFKWNSRVVEKAAAAAKDFKGYSYIGFTPDQNEALYDAMKYLNG